MKMMSLYRAICVCVVGLGPVVACSETSEPDPCFPLPAGAQLAVHGTTYQGTTLQGQSAEYMQGQGTSLQGVSPAIMQQQGTRLQGASPDYMSQQGTSLQGEPPGVMTQQGTSLQGDPPGIMQLQGTSLQGDPPGIMPLQGTSLQGQSPDYMSQQGTSLQGDPPGIMQLQGTSLQGDPPGIMQLQGTSLQGDPPGIMQLQGTSLQGHATLDMPNQGTSLQGEGNIMEQQGTRLQVSAGRQPRSAQPRAYRGLADLNGAHLQIAADTSNAVTVQDGQLVARGFASTASLKGTSLTGVAPDGRTFRIEIVKVTLDGKTERADLLVDGLPACQLDQHGLFVAGRWDAQAAHVADPDVVTYSCMDGVIAKCVSWGYAPWLTGDDVHASCTRLARADYCGTGTPWTMDGTEINVYDTLGVQPESTAADMKFEAAWGTRGALCVARPRYEVRQAGRTVLPGCFASLPRCGSLDEGVALGAVLANRSRVTPIAACE
jgi:hypothetical protein